MSRITKTLLRSILRWTHLPHAKHAPFRIDLSKVTQKQKSLEQLRTYLPPNLMSIHDASGVRAAALYCYRTSHLPEPGSDADSEVQDMMFAVMNYLNSRSAELKVACNSREYRTTDTVVQNAVIRVGQVVQHKELGFRAVCIGWTASAPGRQLLNILVDWFDLEEMQDGELSSGGTFEAADFRVLPDGPQSRVSHQLIPKYFCRYDSSIGAYVPNKSLQFQYPFDVSQVLEASGLFTRISPQSSDASAERIVHGVSGGDPPRERKQHEQATSFSVSHLEKLEKILKTYHQWTGNEVYSMHQEKLRRSCDELQTINRKLYADIHKVFNRRGLPVEKAAISSDDLSERETCHLDVLSEVMHLLLEFKAQALPFNPPPASPSSQHDLRIQSLLIELYGPSIRDAGFDPSTMSVTELSYHMYKRDDNLMFPMSPEQDMLQDLAHTTRIVSTLFTSVERFLVLRFQNLNGRVSEFESRVPRETPAIDHPLPPLLSPSVKFRLGQVLRHKKFGYRGVCAGWDIRPITDTSSWEGVVGLRHGQEQPFYRIIPDEDDVKDFLGSRQQRDFYYVAQDNLEVVETIGDLTSGSSESATDTLDSTDRLLNQIKNREAKTIRNVSMSRFFSGFNDQTGRYEAQEALKFCFSLFPGTPQVQKECNSCKEQKFQECEELLLELYNIINEYFISFKALSKEDHLLFILKHAMTRDDAHLVEALLWLVNLSTRNSSCSILMREGLAVMTRGSLDEALKLYGHASRTDPSFSEAYNKIAGVRALRNENMESLAFCTLALQRQPRHYGALAGQGFALAALAEDKDNRIEDALASLKSSLDINPWVSHVASRYTSMMHEKHEENSTGSRKTKGSLSVVHLISDDPDEESGEEKS